jgi:hypothetical protein
LVEIVDENGQIDYKQALKDIKIFLYGRKGKIDPKLHFQDVLFYLKPKNLLFALKAFSLSILPHLMHIWIDLGFQHLDRYFQLNVIAVINKLKEQAKRKGRKYDA